MNDQIIRMSHMSLAMKFFALLIIIVTGSAIKETDVLIAGAFLITCLCVMDMKYLQVERAIIALTTSKSNPATLGAFIKATPLPITSWSIWLFYPAICAFAYILHS